MNDVILAAVPPGILLSIPHPIRFSDEYVSSFSSAWQGEGPPRRALLSGLAWRIAEAAVCVRRLRSRWQKWSLLVDTRERLLRAIREAPCGGTVSYSFPTDGEEEGAENREMKAAALRRAVTWRAEEVAGAIEAEEEASDFLLDVQLPAVAAAVQATASGYDSRVDEMGRVRGPLLSVAVEHHMQVLQEIADDMKRDPPAPDSGADPVTAWIMSASLAAEISMGTIKGALGDAIDAIFWKVSTAVEIGGEGIPVAPVGEAAEGEEGGEIPVAPVGEAVEGGEGGEGVPVVPVGEGGEGGEEISVTPVGEGEGMLMEPSEEELIPDAPVKGEDVPATPGSRMVNQNRRFPKHSSKVQVRVSQRYKSEDNVRDVSHKMPRDTQADKFDAKSAEMRTPSKGTRSEEARPHGRNRARSQADPQSSVLLLQDRNSTLLDTLGKLHSTNAKFNNPDPSLQFGSSGARSDISHSPLQRFPAHGPPSSAITEVGPSRTMANAEFIREGPSSSGGFGMARATHSSSTLGAQLPSPSPAATSGSMALTMGVATRDTGISSSRGGHINSEHLDERDMKLGTGHRNRGHETQSQSILTTGSTIRTGGLSISSNGVRVGRGISGGIPVDDSIGRILTHATSTIHDPIQTGDGSSRNADDRTGAASQHPQSHITKNSVPILNPNAQFTSLYEFIRANPNPNPI